MVEVVEVTNGNNIIRIVRVVRVGGNHVQHDSDLGRLGVPVRVCVVPMVDSVVHRRRPHNLVLQDCDRMLYREGESRRRRPLLSGHHIAGKDRGYWLVQRGPKIDFGPEFHRTIASV